MKLKWFAAAMCAAIAAHAEAPSFARDVAPIFASNCAACHAAKTKMGALELETFEGLKAGGQHGAAILPGKSAESLLYQRITGEKQPLMPLGGKKLADGEIQAIKDWIDAGAPPPTPAEEKALAARRSPVIPDIKPRVPVKPGIGALAYSPDGKILALGLYKEVKLVDPATQTAVASLGGHAEQIRALAFSPDGAMIAAAGGLPGRSGEVRIWDAGKRTELRAIKGHNDCIYAVAFAPDGKTIATSSYDKLIKLWDVATGAEVRTLKDHIDAIYALGFTPDGKRLVSGAADRTVKIWDVASGQRLYTLSEPQDGLNTIAIDPSGKFVAAGGLDKTIRIWSLGEKSGTLVHTLIAHEDAILKLAYSPDGRMLVSSAADRTIKIFNAADLTEIKTLPDQPDWVLALGFAPDGKKFAAGRFDGSLEIYPVGEAVSPARLNGKSGQAKPPALQRTS